jgi:hypothetical protein
MVHEVGPQLADLDGDMTVVGVDYETVTITMPVGMARFDAAQCEAFAQLFTRACWQAAANKERMHADAPVPERCPACHSELLHPEPVCQDCGARTGDEVPGA